MFGKPKTTNHSNKSYKFAAGGFLGGLAEGFGSTSKWTDGKAKAKPAEPGSTAPTPMPTPAAPTDPTAVPRRTTFIPEVGTRQ